MVTNNQVDRLPLTDLALQPLRDKGLSVSVGRHTYGVPHVAWAPNDRFRSLKIGSYCSIAGGVNIYVGIQGRHTVDFLSTYPMGMIYPVKSPGEISRAHVGNLDVVIGSDVWIGREALIFAGVTIGHGAVIGSRAIITKDIPPYGIAVGAPAKVKSYRFSDNIIDRLLMLRWRSLPESTIRDQIHLFGSSNVEHAVSCLELLKSDQ